MPSAPSTLGCMAYSGNCDNCKNSGVGYSYYVCNKCGHEVCNKCFQNFKCLKCTGTYQGPK